MACIHMIIHFIQTIAHHYILFPSHMEIRAIAEPVSASSRAHVTSNADRSTHVHF